MSSDIHYKKIKKTTKTMERISDERNVTGLLGYKLKQAQHQLRLHMDEALRVLSITTPQYAVLAQLELRPGISNAALARASFITAQTMHGIVTHLEKNRLITRKKEERGGRVLRTELTEEGRVLVQQAHALIAEVETRMTASFSEKNKALFESLLLECFNNLSVNGGYTGSSSR